MPTTPDQGFTVFGGYTLVGIESLLCLREACDDTGLTPADVADIFRGNALRLLAPHLRPPPFRRNLAVRSWPAAAGKASPAHRLAGEAGREL